MKMTAVGMLPNLGGQRRFEIMAGGHHVVHHVVPSGPGQIGIERVDDGGCWMNFGSQVLETPRDIARYEDMKMRSTETDSWGGSVPQSWDSGGTKIPISQGLSPRPGGIGMERLEIQTMDPKQMGN